MLMQSYRAAVRAIYTKVGNKDTFVVLGANAKEILTVNVAV